MKQFIKFTNVVKIFTISKEEPVSEYIINTDEIRSLCPVNEKEFILVPKTNESFNIYNKLLSCIVISKEDYEMAKRILLNDDQSITPTAGNDAGPAIETLEKDADPETKEKELIKRVMKEFNNNIVGASMRLGISVNSLRSKLRKYGLSSCE